LTSSFLPLFSELRVKDGQQVKRRRDPRDLKTIPLPPSLFPSPSPLPSLSRSKLDSHGDVRWAPASHRSNVEGKMKSFDRALPPLLPLPSHSFLFFLLTPRRRWKPPFRSRVSSGRVKAELSPSSSLPLLSHYEIDPTTTRRARECARTSEEALPTLPSLLFVVVEIFRARANVSRHLGKPLLFPYSIARASLGRRNCHLERMQTFSLFYLPSRTIRFAYGGKIVA